MIDTVIFDVGGVLANFNTVSYYKGLGYDDAMAKRLADATMFSGEWKEYDRGVLSEEEIIARFQKKDPEIADVIAECLKSQKGVVTRRDSAIPWIESVKSRGRRTVVLSNFSYPGMRDCSEALDFAEHMDACFWSMEHKVIKPDDAIFLTLFYEYSVDPKHAVFIDDTERNLIAGEKFGLKTILYKSQSQAEAELDALLNAQGN